MPNTQHCESKPIFDSSMSCDHKAPDYQHQIIKHDKPPEPEGGVLDLIEEFRRIMGAIRCELDIEYDKGRIKGADYALMIEKLMDPIMGKAIQYTIEFSKTELEVMMLQHQLSTAGDLHRMEMDLKQMNLVHTEAQAHLTKAQVLETKAKADLVCAQEVKMETEIMKLTADMDLVCTQIGELKLNGTAERKLKDAQTVVQGKQGALYDRQRTGFDDKARNDASKILQDAWAVKAVEEPAAVYGDGDAIARGALARSASK